MDKLKPCPFCGVMPTLYWEKWEDISPTAGCFILEADHEKECFIRRMNGTNYTGQISAFHKNRLVDIWNRRAE